MFRLTLLFIILACGISEAFADEIETVKSWAHYRELMIKDGDSEAEADAQIARLLAGLGSMDRSAGADRVGVAAPSFEFIHPGMEYHQADQFVGEMVGGPEVHAMCSADMLEIRSEIERLLAE